MFGMPKLVSASGKEHNMSSIKIEVNGKEIEIKEHSVNKNKKVKFHGVDENLSQTIQKRNIP